MLCSDDGSGADIRTINIMFHTNKKDSVLQRGRMGRGFKEVLSISSFAKAESRGLIMVFSRNESGMLLEEQSSINPKQGFRVLFDIKHSGSIEDAVSYLRTIIPPQGIFLYINGKLTVPRAITHVVEGELETEIFLAGYWQRRPAKCEVNLIPTGPNETPLIYEMGIPVCPVDWLEPYHCDVLQRVPMNPNRDAVITGYARDLRALCFPVILPEFTRERALAPWAAEAVRQLPSKFWKQRQMFMKTLVTIAYGEKVAQSSPPRGRYNFDADAEEEGYLVLRTDNLPFDLRRILTEVTPTSEEVFDERRKRLTRSSARSSLSIDQVRTEKVKEEYARRAGGIRQAISAYGKERVIDRMAFAVWLARSILEKKELASGEVTVRCAWMPQGVLASWSGGSTLYLSLAYDAIWSKPIGEDLIALVIHEVAHDQAFHHGAEFTHKVEEFAATCAVVLLLEDRQTLMRGFPTFEIDAEKNPQARS